MSKYHALYLAETPHHHNQDMMGFEKLAERHSGVQPAFNFRGGNFHEISCDDFILLIQLFRKRLQIKFSSQHFQK